MSICFLMNLLINYKSSYFRAKMSFLILLNFGCHELNSIRKNLDVYKLMAEKNSLVPYLKTSAIRKALQLTIQHCIYTRKNEIAEQ